MKTNQIIEQRLQRHKDFWNRTNDSPLIGYSLGNYFVSKRFTAVEKLLGLERNVTANDFNVGNFLLDYEMSYNQSVEDGVDVVFAASPFTGLPWMEAMVGCKIIPQESSFIASPIPGAKFNDEIKVIDNSWSDKYFEFMDFINKNCGGKYSSGQPILRGPGDVLAAIFGQKELIFNFYDFPDQAEKRLTELSNILLKFAKKGLEKTKDFYGGYSMGFYPIWCPGKAFWFQDDITALLSPEFYNEFFFNIHQRQSEFCEYTMIHLHPDSFYFIDKLLIIDSLKAVQINKDIGGQSVSAMLPVLRNIQSKKNLVLWGDFTNDEIKFLTGNLNPQGLFIIVHRDFNSS